MKTKEEIIKIIEENTQGPRYWPDIVTAITNLTDQIKSMEEERDVYKKRWENNNDQSDKDFTAINKLFQENKSLKSQLSDVDGQVKEKDRRYEKAMKQWDDERDVFKNQWISLQSQLESLQKEGDSNAVEFLDWARKNTMGKGNRYSENIYWLYKTKTFTTKELYETFKLTKTK